MNAEDTGEKKGGWLTRWRQPKRQEKQLATLQEGFNELVGLTRSIREHMEQQARTQATLVEMMEHLPGAVEGLKGVGDATKQQTETLSLLKQQLEAAARNEDHMMESMRSFNKTLALMDDLSKSTSQTVSSMADRTRDSEDLLRTILERSERRLIYMIVTVMIVTLTVLGVGLYIGLGQRAEAPTPIAPVEEELPAIPEEPPLTEEEAAARFEYQKSITELGDWPEEESEAPLTEAVEEIEPELDIPPTDPEMLAPETPDADLLDPVEVETDVIDPEVLMPETLEDDLLEPTETEIDLIDPVDLIPGEEIIIPVVPEPDADVDTEAEETVEEPAEEDEVDDEYDEDVAEKEEGNGDEDLEDEVEAEEERE